MNLRTIRLAKLLCLAGMVAITLYAFGRLYLSGERADLSILLLNVVLFAAMAVALIYLSKKEKDIDEEGGGGMFRD